MFPILASDNPIHHILDKPVSGIEHISFMLWGKQQTITIHMLSLLIAAFVAFLILRIAAKRIAVDEQIKGSERFLTKGRIAQIIEVITLYMRDNVIRPVLGKETNKFLPYLLSLFYFILACNLLGMIPFADLQVVLGNEFKSYL